MQKSPENILLVVDPQNSFLGYRNGSAYTERVGKKVMTAELPVRGGVEDMDTLAAFVDSDANGEGIDDLIVTLDTHEERGKRSHRREPDIGHPGYWRDQDNKQPAPFMLIQRMDFLTGVWHPYRNCLMNRVAKYLLATKSQMVWPRHCVDGTWGHQVYGPLAEAFARWEKRTGRKVRYVRKGMFPHSEQYGAFMAVLPDPRVKSTRFNWGLFHRLTRATRRVWVAGEASSHCLLSTVQQAVPHLSFEDRKKWTLLTDCMSPVAPTPGSPDFPAMAAEFLKEMQAIGMTLATAKPVAAAA